ncbi:MULTISPECIES: sensor histidine kinase [Niastella]|uniref:histidine kinase n=1 Tax=Niastella soli TaxID=2821487 RepID=A0ABS3YN59_9BACT|nr:PAS domain-containing sensor histidine kinase [Niastella soli]MBO9199284.1 PAS domain-containing protein [Niastella soli]
MEQLINQEITPLKLLFQSNGENDGLPDKITDFFPAIVYIYDAEARKLKYINRKITELLGYTIADVLTWDNDLMSIVHKDDLEKVKTELQHFYALQDNESYSYNSRLSDKTGTWKYFRTMGTVLSRNALGRVASILFIAQDITSEVETEQSQLYQDLATYKAMKQENEKFLDYGTWTFDANTRQYFWSDGMYRLYGYDPDTDKNLIVVNDALYRKHVDEAYFEKHRLFTENILSQKERPEHVIAEYQIKTKDGHLKQIESSGKLFYNEEGRWIKTIGTARDISRLHVYQLNLEEKIRDLDRSNKELEEFAYVASHDMNEPLRKITTFIERLESKYKAELGADGKLYLARISASVENMRHLIDTLLEFSRTTRSNQPFVSVDLNHIAKDVQTDLELKVEETATTLHIELLPMIEAIPSQMKQLFDNLLNNSIKFKRIGIPPVIAIRCLRLTNHQKEQHHLDADIVWFKIEFADNGIGFEPEYSERIFQIFQRLHGKTEYPGSGIGLAICKKIVDQHKGLIYATGRPDNGATFTIILPEHQ